MLVPAVCSGIWNVVPEVSLLGDPQSHAGLNSVLCFAVLFFSCASWARSKAHCELIVGAVIVAASMTLSNWWAR